MVIETMISPPQQWKPMVILKPTVDPNHYRLTRSSGLPNLENLNIYQKNQFPENKIKRHPSETLDWKYQFKTGDLIRIPLSNVITGPVKNDTGRLLGRNPNSCKWIRSESSVILNENKTFELARNSRIKMQLSDNRLHNSSRQQHLCVVRIPLPRSPSKAVSCQDNHGQYDTFLRETIRSLRRCNTEKHFRSLKQCPERSKTRHQETKWVRFNPPFSCQAVKTKLENNFNYKVNVSEIPRSQTPFNEKDPDKISFKNVALFLTDDLGNNTSLDEQNQLGSIPSAIQTAGINSGFDTASEKSFNICCGYKNGSPLPESSEIMNFVSADVFTSPSRSMQSSGAFKTSFRLRKAPKTRTKNESEPLDAHKDVKNRSKPEKFIEFSVSNREDNQCKDGPIQSSRFGKELLVSGSDPLLEKCRESSVRSHNETRDSSFGKVSSGKDFKTLAEISRSRQYTFSYLYRKTNSKKNSMEKSNSDLANGSIKNQTYLENMRKLKSSDGSITGKHGQSVVIIPACTPIANDGGNSSDSEVISEFGDQLSLDPRPSMSKKCSSESAVPLNSGSIFTSGANVSCLSMSSEEIGPQNRRQNQEPVPEKQKQFPKTKPKENYRVKLSFKKEKNISPKNNEYFRKFFSAAQK